MATSVSRAYSVHRAMLGRCLYESHPAYKDYGGRGIWIDPDWTGPGGFENFLADMGEAPPGLTLERVKNYLGYYKGNCKWATQTEQCRNKRNNVFLEVNKVRHCLSEWAEITGLSLRLLSERIKLGWTPEDVVSKDTRKNRNTKKNLFITIEGETLCATEWAEKVGISPQIVLWRIRNGWPLEAAVLLPKGSSNPLLGGKR